MKRRVFGVLMVAMAAILIIGACAGPTATPSPTPTPAAIPTPTATAKPTPTASPTPTATAKPTPTATTAPIVLKWTMQQGPDHRNALLAKKVIQLIEQGSKGRIKFEFYPGEILVKEADTFRAVAEGIVQMGQVSAADWSDRLRLATIVQMPLTAPDTKTYWQSIYKLYETQPELIAEHLKWNLKPIYLYGSGGFDFSNNKRPVKVLEDLKGIKVRAAGGYYVAAAEMLGAMPMAISSSEMYMAIQRKVIDGAYSGIDTQAAYKLQEVVKFVTLAEIQFGTAAVVMNLDTWNKLPADLQQLFNETVNKSVAPDVIEFVSGERQRSVDAFKKAGVEVYELPLAEKTKWAAIILPLWDKWFQTVGPAGKTVMDAFLKLTGMK